MEIQTSWILFPIILYVAFLTSNETLDILTDGGYTAHICLNFYEEKIKFKEDTGKDIFSCNKSNRTQNKCNESMLYLCSIPCGINEKHLKIKTRMSVNYRIKPKFKILNNKTYYQANDNLIIKDESMNESLSLLMIEEINIEFSTNISCSRKYISNKSIICQLNLSQIRLYDKQFVNVSISYGGYTCNRKQFIGNVILKISSNFKNILESYWIYWILIIILFIFLIALPVYVKITSKTKEIWQRQMNEGQIRKQEIDFSNIQYKAFYEYQIAVQSFNNIGKFTKRHFYSFNDFMGNILNIDLNIYSNDNNQNVQEDFENIILKKDMLIKWIEKVELNCKVKDKCALASYLTLFLIHYPEYFLDVMKSLIMNLMTDKKKGQGESLINPKSNMIIEKMIGYWLSLCLYENIKTSDMGERLFNLYRGIKSKIETGLVDNFTCKAKYALSFDNLLLGDLEYQLLIIDVKVKIKIRLMNSEYLEIEMDSILVNVLSLDSISQVKEKIIDKVIMEYVKSENLSETEENSNLCIAPLSFHDFKLLFIKNNIKIQLDDFDNTSITSIIDKKCIIVNTMRHYNMKSGMKFLLIQEGFSTLETTPVIKKSFLPDNEIEIHLQIPKRLNVDQKNKSNYSIGNETKLLFNPITENTSKEAYLFMLLATKKSLVPLIDGLIQSITCWKPLSENENGSTLRNKYSSQDDLVNNNSSFVQSDADDENYCRKLLNMKPVFYIFSLYERIAKSLYIFDEEIINSWKTYCYIHQVWANLIKNPSLIFPVQLDPAVGGSLNTVANVLIESCYVESIYSGIELDLPLIKQLFMDDVKTKYSIWWQAFIDSHETVTEEEMTNILKDVVEKNELHQYKSNSLKALQRLSKTLLIEIRPKTSDSTMWCLE